MTPDSDGLHEYEVWSTYKVTGTAIVRARSAAEAVEKALDVGSEDHVEFIFGEPWGETKMRARRVNRPAAEDPTRPVTRPLPEGMTLQCREDEPLRHCTVSCAMYRTGHGECPPRVIRPVPTADTEDSDE